jgi:hypothetical protein
MLRISAGWSPVLPNQCGTRVSNSAASPSSRTRSWSPEDQTHPAGEGEQPLVPFVRLGRRFAVTRRDVDLPGLHPARGAGQGHAKPRPQLLQPRPDLAQGGSDGGCRVLHSPIPPRPSRKQQRQ